MPRVVKQQATNLIVDDNGKLYHAQSQELRDRHHLDESAGDLPAFLIRNSGHVGIRFSPRSDSVIVLFRQDTIGDQTISAVADYLIAIEPTHIVAEVVGDNPHLQLLGDVEDLIAMLVEGSRESSSLQRPKYFQQPLSLQRLKTEARLSLLRQRYDHWRRSAGTMQDIDRSSTIASPQEYTARMPPDDAELFEIGPGYPETPAMEGRLPGSLIHEQRDRSYGAWVTRCLQEVAMDFHPKLELVEATVRIPSKAPFRIRYERLLLPWTGRAGRIVSSTSVTRASFVSTRSA